LFRRIVRERQGPLVGSARSGMITKVAQQLGAGGMQEVIATQPIGHLINFG
jgi:hypothetical protein